MQMSKLLSVCFTYLLGQFDVNHNSTSKFYLYNTVAITPSLLRPSISDEKNFNI